MTAIEFQKKYKKYLSKGHYGMSLRDEVLINFLDKIFEDLVKIPGFEYQQIKTKFNSYRFYAKGVSHVLTDIIEKELYRLKPFINDN